MSISWPKPKPVSRAARAASAAWTIHADVARSGRVSGTGLRRGQAGAQAIVDQQAPDLLVGDRPDEIFDVDAPVAEGSALAVGLGDRRGEGNDAVEARLDVAAGRTDGAHRLRTFLVIVCRIGRSVFLQRNVLEDGSSSSHLALGDISSQECEAGRRRRMAERDRAPAGSRRRGLPIATRSAAARC